MRTTTFWTENRTFSPAVLSPCSLFTSKKKWHQMFICSFLYSHQAVCLPACVWMCAEEIWHSFLQLFHRWRCVILQTSSDPETTGYKTPVRQTEWMTKPEEEARKLFVFFFPSFISYRKLDYYNVKTSNQQVFSQYKVYKILTLQTVMQCGLLMAKLLSWSCCLFLWVPW